MRDSMIRALSKKAFDTFKIFPEFFTNKLVKTNNFDAKFDSFGAGEILF